MLNAYINQFPDFVGRILCQASTDVLGQFHICLIMLLPEDLYTAWVETSVTFVVALYKKKKNRIISSAKLGIIHSPLGWH